MHIHCEVLLFNYFTYFYLPQETAIIQFSPGENQDDDADLAESPFAHALSIISEAIPRAKGNDRPDCQAAL